MKLRSTAVRRVRRATRVVAYRLRRHAWALMVPVAFVTASCGLSREAGPAAILDSGQGQVVGRVVRDGAPVSGMEVILFVHSPEEPAVDSTLTDANGYYSFREVPLGSWVARVSPRDRRDLGYVRAFFEVVDPDVAIEIPKFDIHPHGLVLLDPAQDASIPLPSPSSPLVFLWSEYELPYLLAGARVSENGVIAWTSPRSRNTQAAWNGYGNRGIYNGQPLAPGSYFWRVKLQLSSQMQAGSQLNTIVLE